MKSAVHLQPCFHCLWTMNVNASDVCAGYLMSEFTALWFSEKPKDIMEFSRIRDKFQRRIASLLKDPTTVLKADFQEQ